MDGRCLSDSEMARLNRALPVDRYRRTLWTMLHPSSSQNCYPLLYQWVAWASAVTVGYYADVSFNVLSTVTFVHILVSVVVYRLCRRCNRGFAACLSMLGASAAVGAVALSLHKRQPAFDDELADELPVGVMPAVTSVGAFLTGLVRPSAP